MTKEHAINWIRKSVDKNSRLWKAIEALAPDITDSEDERIRKHLIARLKPLNENDGIFDYLITKDKVLAYLEKQKAKERLDRMAPIYNDKESFESALEKAWKYYNESTSRTVDSFEDDYIECVFSKGFREGFLYKEKQKEQKPKNIVTNNDSLRTAYLKGQTDVIEDPKSYGLQKEQKLIKCIEFNNEFENQVSHLIASVLNGEHEYNEGFIKYVAQSLFEFVKKEQKPIVHENDCVSKPKTSLEILKHYLVWAENSEEDCPYSWKELADAIKDGIAALEQKPVEYLSKKKIYDIMNKLTELSTSNLIPVESEEYVKIHEITSDVCSLLDYLIEQKPTEWSKEDEEMRVDILQDIANMKEMYPKVNFQDELDWLKTLPERFNLQPKQQWSKEDNIMFGNIILCLKEYCLTDEINWFKSSFGPQSEKLTAEN